MTETHRPHLKDRLRQAFENGSESEVMRRLTTPEQLQEARKIKEQAFELQEKAKSDHELKYAVRVKHTIAKVRDEWTRPARILTPRDAMIDRLDASDLRFEAEKRVRKRFEALVARIGVAEQRQLRRLAGLPERTPQDRPHRIDQQRNREPSQIQSPRPQQSRLRQDFERSR